MEENSKKEYHSDRQFIAYKETPIPNSSFEEMNEADAKAKALILPEQHLINVTKMINEMYADELKTPMDKTLRFRKND